MVTDWIKHKMKTLAIVCGEEIPLHEMLQRLEDACKSLEEQNMWDWRLLQGVNAMFWIGEYAEPKHSVEMQGQLRMGPLQRK